MNLGELRPECVNYVGRLLAVKPFYGWGWSRDGQPLPSADYDRIYRARLFAVRVDRFFHWKAVLRGAIGRIEQAQHPLNRSWIVFYTYADDVVADFQKALCPRFDLRIGPEEPLQAEGWPLVGGHPRLSGYGCVGESPSHIARAHDRWRDHPLSLN